MEISKNELKVEVFDTRFRNNLDGIPMRVGDIGLSTEDDDLVGFFSTCKKIHQNVKFNADSC